MSEKGVRKLGEKMNKRGKLASLLFCLDMLTRTLVLHVRVVFARPFLEFSPLDFHPLLLPLLSDFKGVLLNINGHFTRSLGLKTLEFQDP